MAFENILNWIPHRPTVSTKSCPTSTQAWIKVCLPPYLHIASSSLTLKPSTQKRIRRRPCRIRQVRHHSPSRATASSPFTPVAVQLGKNGFINGSGNGGTSTIIGTQPRSPACPRLWNIAASWRRWSSIGIYRLYTLCEEGGGREGV